MGLTKRQALEELRKDPFFRICLPKDFDRLAHHLGNKAKYVNAHWKGVKLRAIWHKELYFIPCDDPELCNVEYKPTK